MKKFLTIGLVFAALFIQTTSFDFFTFRGIKPDLGLILVIYFALLHGPITTIGAGIAIGLLEDILSGGLMGLNLFTKPLIGYLFSLIGHQVVVVNPVNQGVLVFLGSLLNGGLTYLILKVTPVIIPGKALLFKLIFLQAIYNGLLGVILIPILQRLYCSSHKKRKSMVR